MRTLPSAVRATGWPIRPSTYFQVAGITCITPQAPTFDTTPGWNPDSCQAIARARCTSTP